MQWVCSVSIAITPGHRIILMLSVNVGTKFTSKSMFGLELLQTSLQVLVCYLTAQPYHDFLITVLQGLLEDLPL